MNINFDFVIKWSALITVGIAGLPLLIVLWPVVLFGVIGCRYVLREHLFSLVTIGIALMGGFIQTAWIYLIFY